MRKSKTKLIEVFYHTRWALFLHIAHDNFVTLIASWDAVTSNDSILEDSINLYGLTKDFPYLTYTLVEK